MTFDVLVIQTEKNSGYWESTFDSLENQPITVHKVPGDGKSQLENFLIWPDVCTSEFISFVDDDDLVVEGAFEKCSEHLQQNPLIKALYTNSECIDDVKHKQKKLYKEEHEWTVDFHRRAAQMQVHQLIIVKRTLVQYAIGRLQQLIISKEDTDKHIHRGNNHILWDIIATQTPWHYFPEVCYTWRRHQASTSYTAGEPRRDAIRFLGKRGRSIFRHERVY